MGNITAIRWTDKNKAYLTKIGFIDGRSGKKKKEELNLNHFVNECVTVALETHRTGLSDAVNDKMLLKSFLELQRRIHLRDVEGAGRKLRRVNELIDDLEEPEKQSKYIEILQEITTN